MVFRHHAPSPPGFVPALATAWLLLASPFLHAEPPGAAAYRNFTNRDGQTVRARLLDVQNGQALLRLSSGRDSTVPLATLSDPDQAWITAWNPRERLAAPPPNPGALTALLSTTGYRAAPLTIEGKSVLIDVQINGNPFRFLFDTGRVLTLLDREVAQSLNVRIFEDLEFGEFPLPGGGVAKVLAGATNSLSVGPVAIPNFELGVVDLQAIGIEQDGILAADVLQYGDGIVDWGTLTVHLKPQ